MVPGKLPVPGRPTYLDNSRARAYCVCSGSGLFEHFSLVYLFSPLRKRYPFTAGLPERVFQSSDVAKPCLHGDPTDMRESTSVFQIRTINGSKLDKRQVSMIDPRRK